MSGNPVVAQSPLRDAIVIDMTIPVAPGSGLTPTTDDFREQVDQYLEGGVTWLLHRRS
jgi:hypothetical protein